MADETRRTAQVRERLLAWWSLNARDLPWRHTRDPYRILVSEVMLQQTQVDRVIPLYHAFLERFPTLEALAEAPTADVIRQWAGLGYNRRAVNMQRTARAVIAEHGGVFPQSSEALLALPGIGPYTAGAIAAFAFERDVAFIDTNIRRVLHRWFVGSDVPVVTTTERAILALAEQVVPTAHGWTWNQALIEFGALQCTARKPACVICPMQDICAAFPTVQSDLAMLPKGVRLKKDSAFKDSNRYYRGRVVEALRDSVRPGAGIPLAELGPIVREGFSDDDLPWLRGVVDGLARDGLAMIAENELGYDPGNAKVRLP